MGLIVKECTKRDGRGRKRKLLLIRGFDSPGIFDIPYNATLDRHFILHELRLCTGQPPAYLNRGRNKKKSERLGRYERHVPSMWKAAILRDAPLLKGFLEEEPAWRTARSGQAGNRWRPPNYGDEVLLAHLFRHLSQEIFRFTAGNVILTLSRDTGPELAMCITSSACTPAIHTPMPGAGFVPSRRGRSGQRFSQRQTGKDTPWRLEPWPYAHWRGPSRDSCRG